MVIEDLPLLRDRGFESGFSGVSWFGTDVNGVSWQAYIDERSDALLFVTLEDRQSKTMTREQFEGLFHGRKR